MPGLSSMEGYLAAKVPSRACGARPRLQAGLINGLDVINASFGGFNVSFNSRKHTASTFVDLSMLTEDGGVRR